ncbi:AraC family transcriptional regulator [Mucilaginibacter agri]|uniref:Helix-turn-helix domain-containing protein n=1 Tax=Mucilaginibacter agri TaxID=2695265 RepID=A0A965ZHE8_9SPHI|nr:AraC family transcriptional regulator [Mucilaginibacter agri]NCD70168.1 helix-turn-helix domain-containing protein [Mucilaginibacter agri]
MQPLSSAEQFVEIDRHRKSVYVMHQKAERRFPVHQHKKAQLSYVEGGIAYVHFVGNTFVIPARHYIWIPPGVDHFLQVRQSETAVVRNIYYPDDNKHIFYQHTGIYPVNNLLYEMIHYTENYDENVEPNSSDYAFLTAIKSILPNLSPQNVPIVLPTTTNERLRPILRYLYDHVAQPLTLKSVSQKFNIAERSLSRLFQTVLSISFLQYLKQVRMVRAVELMLQTDQTLSQIAFETGYQSISAFSNTFYQLANMRPSEFAQTIR